MSKTETLFVTCCQCFEEGEQEVEMIYSYPPLGRWVCECGTENFYDGSELDASM